MTVANQKKHIPEQKMAEEMVELFSIQVTTSCYLKRFYLAGVATYLPTY